MYHIEFHIISSWIQQLIIYWSKYWAHIIFYLLIRPHGSCDELRYWYKYINTCTCTPYTPISTIHSWLHSREGSYTGEIPLYSPITILHKSPPPTTMQPSTSYKPNPLIPDPLLHPPSPHPRVWVPQAGRPSSGPFWCLPARRLRDLIRSRSN